jgi:hypothetical protein
MSVSVVLDETDLIWGVRYNAKKFKWRFEDVVPVRGPGRDKHGVVGAHFVFLAGDSHSSTAT